MLASVSDDGTVRIWGPPPPDAESAEACGKSDSGLSLRELHSDPYDGATDLEKDDDSEDDEEDHDGEFDDLEEELRGFHGNDPLHWFEHERSQPASPSSSEDSV